MKKTVIFVEFGGLGDHLFHSPLPRLLKENGLADKVYLSKYSRFRNKDTYDFVWSNNPYLDGYSDEGMLSYAPVAPTVDKVINHTAAMYGITGFNEELYPEIYSVPEYRECFEGMDVLDLNYISFVGALTAVDMIGIAKRYPKYKILNPSAFLRAFVDNEPIYTKSLKEYLSIVYSCRQFVCLTSGGATVAAALRKRATTYYGWGQTNVVHHSCNENIMIGDDGLYRQILCRILWKKNQLRLLLSDSK